MGTQMTSRSWCRATLSPARKRSSAAASDTSTPCFSFRTCSITVRLKTTAPPAPPGFATTAFGVAAPVSGSSSTAAPWSASAVRTSSSTIRVSRTSTSSTSLTTSDASYSTARLASRPRSQELSATSGRFRIWLPMSAATVRRMADGNSVGRNTSRVRSTDDGASSSNRRTVSPTPMRSPFRSTAVRTSCPFSSVPLPLPRSCSSTPAALGRSSQCRRETRGSVSGTGLAE